jgi:AraC-like DNA-binding protein
MAAEAEQYTVRGDFAHALANACQRFVGALLIVEPGVFLSAVTHLTLDMPDADSPAELLMAWTTVQKTVLLGALAHHASFHRWFQDSPCTFQPQQPLHSREMLSDATSFSSLTRWAADYARAFDDRHLWPAAVRAARLLQTRSANAWYVEDLAHLGNVSPGTLERGFRKIYGLTVQQYQSLVRLRSVAQAVRADEGVIEGVILDLGYRSIKDAYKPFRRMTGMTVARVRGMTESRFASLMSGPLRLPVPGQPVVVETTAHT